MKKAYKKCPICFGLLQGSSFMSSMCGAASGITVSFVDSFCNANSMAGTQDHKLDHSFFQEATLQDDCLFDQVYIFSEHISIANNYIKQIANITYYSNESSQSISFDNKVFEFDYPKLEKLIAKTK